MKPITFVLLFLVVGSAVVVAVALSHRTPGPAAAGKLSVSASFYPLAFFSSTIAGGRADIRTITPAGAEPHDYEPTSQDIARIETGSLLILNGGVEAWGERIQETLRGASVRLVVAGSGLLSKQLVEEGQTITDPHIWLDPVLAKQEAAAIAAGFQAEDPSNANVYRMNEQALDARLDDLDAAYRAGLSNCQSKDIVTSHAAFGYLAARYGLNQVTVTGISPDAEPSAQQLAAVARFARDHHVKYIFFESLISPKLSETIAREVGAQTLVLDPIEGITSEDAAAGHDYFTVMAQNLTNLRTALSCT